MTQASSTRTSTPAIFCGTENPSSSPICTAQRLFDPFLLSQRLWSLVPSLSLLKVSMGKGRFPAVSRCLFCSGPSLSQEEREIAFKRFFSSMEASAETMVEEPDQTLPEGEHRIFGEARGGDNGLPSKGFPPRSDQRGCRKA